MKIKTSYRKKLPHIQPIGATFFVTFLLKDALPKTKYIEIKNDYHTKLAQFKNIKEKQIKNSKLFHLRKQYLIQIDQVLDQINSGNHFLKQNDIAEIVANQLHRFDDEFYQLVAYSIMSNHVHILIDTSIQIPDSIKDLDDIKKYTNLHQIMRRIKGASVFYANQKLVRKGSFWESENFDTYVRNSKMYNNVIAYILNNPVKAKIVNKWQDYKWNYLCDEEI